MRLARRAEFAGVAFPSIGGPDYRSKSANIDGVIKLKFSEKSAVTHRKFFIPWRIIAAGSQVVSEAS